MGAATQVCLLLLMSSAVLNVCQSIDLCKHAVQTPPPSQEAIDNVKRQVMVLQTQLDRSEASAKKREVRSMLLAEQGGLPML